jgi:hypothetical protein
MAPLGAFYAVVKLHVRVETFIMCIRELKL